MKDRIIIWSLIPLIFIITILTDISLNYDINNLNQEIINFIPYPHDNIDCVGCCSLECLEGALITTINAKIMLPFFSVVMIVVFTIIVGIVSYCEIKEEKREEEIIGS